jgi:hypothetical protein
MDDPRTPHQGGECQVHQVSGKYTHRDVLVRTATTSQLPDQHATPPACILRRSVIWFMHSLFPPYRLIRRTSAGRHSSFRDN